MEKQGFITGTNHDDLTPDPSPSGEGRWKENIVSLGKLIVMKSLLLPIAACMVIQFSYAQVYGDDDFKTEKERKEIKKQLTDSIVSEIGFVVRIGDKLFIGRGSQPDGDFKNIVRNQSGAGTFITASTNAKKNNEQFSLNKNWKGATATVVKFVKRNNYLIPLVSLKGGGGVKWEIDIDPAIESGELDVPDMYKTKTEAEKTIVIQQQQSIADEILKLKKLYDDGVLSKEEFEAGKKKLLDK